MAEIDDLRAQLECAKSEVLELKSSLDEALAEKNGAYSERNKLVAYLARQFPSGRKQTDIEGWDPKWQGCVYIDTPEGQLSWHYQDSESGLFEALPLYQDEWDGHSTSCKYARLQALITKHFGSAGIRQQLAAAEARLKELEEERGHIADVIAGLLNVYLRYEGSIDPDYETVETINRGKAALEALRKDLGTDVVPSSTGAKC